MINLCACTGASEDDPYCLCEMEKRGLKQTISETWISREVWNLLSDEDKNTINSLKTKALSIYFDNI